MPTGAEAILRSLKLNGIDALFTNPGSDFAPVIEAYAAHGASGDLPLAVQVPHENLAVTMAHGYWLATGRMQAAAMHVNVGLANAAMGLINAHSDNVPVFAMSGRNPLTEGNRPGARMAPIQYGQEMFDQTAMVREVVKWDYELRYAENAADLVSRGAAIARMEPQGSVYLSLPREPLCEEVPLPGPPTQATPAPMGPDATAIRQAAEALAGAKNPLIICSRGDPAGRVGAELAALSEENAIAVSEVFVTRNVLPSDHPCNIGGNLKQTLPGRDVVLVLDAGVAWIESMVHPDADATVIHLGPDPLFTRIPVRGFRASLAIQTEVAAGLAALRAALPGKPDPARLSTLRDQNAAFRGGIRDKAAQGATGAPSKGYVAQCVSAILGDTGRVFSERGGVASTFTLTGPNRFFGNTQAGGLGWCLPAALGAQLARPDRLTVAIMGDGSYLFANPIACLQVARAQRLPVLMVILNNAGYEAVRMTTLEVYPGGATAASNTTPLVAFEPNPDHAAVAAAMGCHAESVTDAADLPAALARAVQATQAGQPALLDVHVRREY